MFSVSSKRRCLGCSRQRARAAFEAQVFAFQPHAATEQLNDLRTFLPPDVQEAHARHAPGVPAFHEFFGANQDVEGRMGTIDTLKERTADGVLLQHNFRSIRFDQFLEFGSVANVDQAKVVLGASGFQAQFAGAAFDVAQVQAARSGGMENALQNVVVECRRRISETSLAQERETPGKDVLPIGRDQARLAFQNALDGLDRPGTVAQHAVQKTRHGQHIAARLFVFGIDGVDRAADEHPQRFFQVVGAQGVGLFLVKAHLFVERKQVAEQ
jgi:hypothetical protein